MTKLCIHAIAIYCIYVFQIYVSCDLMRYFTLLCRQICEYLDIECFSIKVPEELLQKNNSNTGNGQATVTTESVTKRHSIRLAGKTQ